MGARFRLCGEEPYEYFEDTKDLYDDGTPKSYWFDDYEDFCDIVDKLNQLDAQIPKTPKWKTGKDYFKEIQNE